MRGGYQMSATGWVRAKVGPIEVVESSRRVGQGGDQGLQLLRGRGVRLLVSPRTGQAGRDQLRSGPGPWRINASKVRRPIGWMPQRSWPPGELSAG